MLRYLLLAAVALAMGWSVAEAHGPTRQKVVSKIEIDAPADKVWQAIGNFQDMGWHPAIAKTVGNGGNTPGATRVLTLKSGGTIDETLTGYDAAARTLSYEIVKVDVKVLPVSNYSSTISVAEISGKSVVEWRGAFYRGFLNNDPPPELSDEAAVNAIKGVYTSGLEALKAKLGKSG